MNHSKRKEHNREQILEKGLELFVAQGYHATGLNGILSACQVPKGSFYNFFGSKEQFALEIIEHYHALEFDRWQQEFSLQQGPLFEKMRTVLEQEVNRLEKEPGHRGCLLANFAGEVGNATEAFRLAIQQATQQVIDSISNDFATCRAQGSLRDDIAPQVLAQLFWDSWQGALLRMKVERSGAPLRAVIDIFWRHILPPQQKEHFHAD